LQNVDAPTCNERLLLSLGYRYTVQRNAIGPRCILVINMSPSQL